MTRSRRPYGMRLVVILALLFGAQTAFADVLKVGDRAAELDVAVDANGKAVKLKSWKGKWLLVTAGAGWCKPCAKELPTWDKVAAEFKDKVVFLSLTLDNDIDDGKKFQKKMNLKNMVVAYMPEEKSGVAARYGAATMPSTFIIDPQGVVRHVHPGFAERDASGEAKKLKKTLTDLTK
jgi:peroxiredoxin